MGYNDLRMYSEENISDFCERVVVYFAEYRRDMPWRDPLPDGSYDPYRIMVSEIMLQQTQVQRVIPKYGEFLARFPDMAALAGAELGSVLRAWQGLGYNRRAKYLWQTAGQVVNSYAGRLPTDQTALTALPGIGQNTAGAICAYAYDKPVVFVETNIRTVIIHEFFPEVHDVSDSDILRVVRLALQEGTLRAGSVREWYWALMDYGVYIKAEQGNLAKQARAYVKQSPLEGSLRQLRGKVLRLLAERPRTMIELADDIADHRLERVIADLLGEGMIKRSGQLIRI